MSKPIKPEYQAWRNRIEGQIRHAINEHPEWFNLPTEEIKARAMRSIGKRIIGEIVAGTATGNNSSGNVIPDVTARKESNVQTAVRYFKRLVELSTASRRLTDN